MTISPLIHVSAAALFGLSYGVEDLAFAGVGVARRLSQQSLGAST